MTAFPFWYPGDEVVLWGVNVLLQVTLVAAIALLVARCVRQNPAARYWILCSVLFLMLLSPVTALLVESSGLSFLSVSLLEGQPGATIKETAVGDIGEAKTEETEGEPSLPFTDKPLATPLLATDVPIDPRTAVIQSDPVIADVQNETSLTEQPAGNSPVRQEERDAQSSAYSIGMFLRVTMPPVLLLWSVGALFFLARLLRGWLKLAAMLRKGEPIAVKSLGDVLTDACRALGTARTPRLVSSPSVTSPIAAGIRCPRVILPDGILDQVSPSQLRDILIHEMAHVLRRDQVIVLVQNLAAVVFWLHPLVRLVNRQLACAREEICDNHVLVSTDAPSYSRTLLRLAELVQRSDPLPASVGLLNGHWKLEHRVAGILNERRSKMTQVTLRGATLILIMSFMLAVLGAGATITVADADAASAKVEDGGSDVPQLPLPSTRASSATNTNVAQNNSKQPNSDLITVVGRVVDRATAVQGADVRVRLMRQDGRFYKLVKTWRLKSDKNGKYRLASRQLSGKLGRYFLELDIVANGFADFRRSVYKPRVRDSTIQLAEARLEVGTTISGRCVDADSNPVADAFIRCVGFASNNPWSTRPRITEKDGRFKLTIPKGAAAELLISSRQWSPRRVTLTAEKSELGDLRLEPGTRVTGRVLSQTGQTIAGCVVAFESADRGNLPGAGFSIRFAAKTNREGKFVIPPIKGRFEIWLAEVHSGVDLEEPIYADTSPQPILPQVLEFDGKAATRELILRCGPEVKVSGTIFMPDGKRATGVEVMLHAATSGLGPGTAANFMRQAITDAQGHYTFAGVPHGLETAFLIIPPKQMPGGRLLVVRPFGKVTAKYRYEETVLTLGKLKDTIEHLDFQYENRLQHQAPGGTRTIKEFAKPTDPNLSALGEEFQQRREFWERNTGETADPAWSKHPRNTLAFRFVEFAEKHPDHSVAISALRKVFRTAAATGDPGAEVVKARDRAIDVVLARLMDHPNVLVFFYYLKNASFSTKAETLLRAALSKSPHREVRGAACLYLALYLRQKARLPEARSALQKQRTVASQTKDTEPIFERLQLAAEQAASGVDPARLRAESRQLLERVLKEFGDVKYEFQVGGPARVYCWRVQRPRPDAKSLGGQARYFLNSLNVAVGEPAIEIEGSAADGQRFSLSQYRGKVVLLTFSANWCSPCKAMYPDLRELVDRMKGKPFALLSVSTDFKVDSLRQSLSKGEITWRCWWDGGIHGPIATSWGVEKFPSVFVIDHRGIIRYRDLKGSALDGVVEKLVGAMNHGEEEVPTTRSGPGVGKRK